MAKRHPSLVSLSQDHHHGLALALRLRHGTNALLNDGWTHNRAEQANRVLEFYDRELRVHFKAEEDVVFPVAARHLTYLSSTVETLIRQHREMERLIGELQRTQGVQLEQHLVSLGGLLEKHIRAEERELFEMLQSQLPADTLEEMGDAVKRIHQHV